MCMLLRPKFLFSVQFFIYRHLLHNRVEPVMCYVNKVCHREMVSIISSSCSCMIIINEKFRNKTEHVIPSGA